MELTDYVKGTVLLYVPYENDEDIEAAKMYCKENGLTPE